MGGSEQHTRRTAPTRRARRLLAARPSRCCAMGGHHAMRGEGEGRRGAGWGTREEGAEQGTPPVCAPSSTPPLSACLCWQPARAGATLTPTRSVGVWPARSLSPPSQAGQPGEAAR